MLGHPERGVRKEGGRRLVVLEAAHHQTEKVAIDSLSFRGISHILVVRVNRVLQELKLFLILQERRRVKNKKLRRTKRRFKPGDLGLASR